MKTLIISDDSCKTATHDRIMAQLDTYFLAKGFSVDTVTVSDGMLKPCMGCFGCWIKTPGKCVIRDDIDDINRAAMNCDALVWLCPVIFGQMSANIKNALDRWLPNMLPFFVTRNDGSTMHPPRYDHYPQQLMIGYGDSLSDDDSQLFRDITEKHRTGVPAHVVHMDTDIALLLDTITFEKIGGPL